VKLSKPDLVAIDAPLNLPPGRRTIEDRNGEHFRPCDRELLKRGIRFFPITLGPMRSLTTRGIALKRKLVRRGFKVIEMFPGAAQDVWRIARKQEGLGKLQRGLNKLGLRGLDRKMNGDELDAVTGALVGRLFLEGKAEVMGNFKEGAIIVPMGTDPAQARETSSRLSPKRRRDHKPRRQVRKFPLLLGEDKR
jgi:predicted nuclease with RNAse H fold